VAGAQRLQRPLLLLLPLTVASGSPRLTRSPRCPARRRSREAWLDTSRALAERSLHMLVGHLVLKDLGKFGTDDTAGVVVMRHLPQQRLAAQDLAYMAGQEAPGGGGGEGEGQGEGGGEGGGGGGSR